MRSWRRAGGKQRGSHQGKCSMEGGQPFCSMQGQCEDNEQHKEEEKEEEKEAQCPIQSLTY
jgi:hypothetical protein